MNMVLEEFYINEVYRDVVMDDLLSNLKHSQLLDQITELTLKHFIHLGMSAIIEPYHKDLLLTSLTQRNLDIDLFNLHPLRRTSTISHLLDKVLEATVTVLTSKYGYRFLYENDIIGRHYANVSTDSNLVRYHLNYLSNSKTDCVLESYLDFMSHLAEQVQHLFAKHRHERMIDIGTINQTFFVCIKERLSTTPP
jgi:hypothetical protein